MSGMKTMPLPMSGSSFETMVKVLEELDKWLASPECEAELDALPLEQQIAFWRREEQARRGVARALELRGLVESREARPAETCICPRAGVGVSEARDMGVKDRQAHVLTSGPLRPEVRVLPADAGFFR